MIIVDDNVVGSEAEIRKEGDVILPSGTVLRKSDQDIADFFREQVVPGIGKAQNAADAQYTQKLTEQYAPKDRTWKESILAAIRNTPPAGAASASALVKQAGEARRERGPAQIMESVLSGIDPEQANAYIADHLADDPEFAAAAERMKTTVPAESKLSDEDVEQMRSALTPAQRKQYDKAVQAEETRITADGEALRKAADVAWKRQAQKLQQGITERLVEDMARRNMPKNELEAFARTAYNASIPGLLMEWAVGSVAGDDESKALHAQIMQRAMDKYDPTLATKIGGEVAGLLLSGPVFSAGSAVGKTGAAGLRKLAERNAMKRLMARGITKGAEGTAQRLVERSAWQQLKQAAVASGTTLGSYDALATPLAMAGAGEEVSAADVLGATGKGFATGMLLPGIGMAAGRAADAATSRLGRYAAELGGFAAENAAFVGMGTLYNGLRTGEWGSPEQLAEEFGHSVGVLGIMKSIGALKRGREKNPGFYNKVLAETEFTPEEVEALGRAGVDGRSYKRAVYDLLNAKETVGGREVAERAAEQLGSRYADVMQSAEVPISAKAKFMYLIEGRIPARVPLTTDVRRTVGEDGRTTVDLTDPAGNLIQRRTFATERAAEAFERESAGVREINTIQYYENRLEEQRSRTALDDAVQSYAAERGMGTEAIKAEVLKAAQGQPHDTETVRQVVERARPLREQYDDVPAMLADGIALKYGLGEGGFDRALTLKEFARTPNQRAAVAEYASRLKEFVTQERQAADTPERRAERQLMQQVEEQIGQTRNMDDDVIYTATMQDGQQVNIIKGAGLVYDPQTGEVDAAQSEPTVVVRYDDGTMRQVAVGQIDMIVEAVSADDTRAEALKAVRTQLDAAARMDALAEAAGTGGMVQLQDGRIGVVEGINGDGTYNIAVQDAEGQIVTEQITAEEVVGPVEDEQMPEVGLTADPWIGRSLTAEEAQQVVGQMQAAAVPAPQIELTPDNWTAEFGEDGKVQTPLGEVKMGENQYLKMLKNDHGAQFGMVKPTLTDPDVVVEDKSEAADGAVARPSSMVFVKTFVKPDGQTMRYFTSVTVNRDGMEVVVSNHLKEKSRVNNLLKNGKLQYRVYGGPQSEQVQLPVSATTSQTDAGVVDKDTTSVPEMQIPGPEVPRTKDGQPDFNAMQPEMLAMELSAVVGHEKAAERIRVAREVNAKKIDKLQKALEGMGDLNKAMATEQQLTALQQEDVRLAGALEQLGVAETPAAAKEAGETFTQEIDRLFPEGLPNVRSRILADVARGQRFVWNDSPDGVKRGVATELGFSGNENERRARFGILGTEGTGARHVSRYVHDLWEDSNGYAFDMDDAAMRNEVIDVLLTTPSRAAAMKQLRDMATRNVEDTTLPRDAEDQAAMQAYEAGQNALRESQKNATFAEKTSVSERDRREAESQRLVNGERYGAETEESRRDNDVRRKTDGGRVSGIGARTVPSDGNRSAGQEYKPGVDAFAYSVSEQGKLYDATTVRMVNDGQANEATVQIRRNDDGDWAANHRGLSGRNRNESGRGNDERRKADSRRLSGNRTGVELAVSDRSDIRVFEEGLGTSHYEHSEHSERDRREAESQRLVDVAKANGLYIDPKEWDRFGLKYPKRTGESVVYIDEAAGKVYKIKNPYAKAAIRGGVPEEVIYDHIIHNLLFPEAAYRFEGISDHLGDVRIVLSQDYIDTYRQPTQQQIDTALAGRGLFPEDKYTYGNNFVSVTDVEGDNALLGHDGRIYFIDPIIKLKKPAQEVIDVLEADTSVQSVPFSVREFAAPAPAGVTPERWRVIVERLRRVVGAENVETDPEAVREAYDQIVRRGEEVRRQQVEQTNERFNTQLEQLTPENADGTILDLGMPSPEMLAVGIPNHALRLYGNKLLKKAHRHGYDISDLHDLPQAIERPIAIFKGQYAMSYVLLTEIDINGNKAVATIDISKNSNVSLNLITSVYGKNADGIRSWIEESKLLYVRDKEKTLEIASSSALNAGRSSNQGSVTATNIVTSFENPKIGPENMGRSVVADSTLVGVHNLTEDNILHAERMGGLANPSMAVIDMAQGGEYDNFGDITLAAPRALIDKSSGKNTGTYGADVYTPRYPQIERQYGEKFQQFADEIDAFVKTHFDSDTPIAKRYARNRTYLDPTNASSGESALKREPYMQAYYAENALGRRVQKNASEEQINRMVSNPSDFYQWVNDTFSGLAEKEVIPAGLTSTGRQRYLDHTLENVSRFMKAQGRVGSEGYDHGLGSLRSHFAPRFATLKQIRTAKNRLQTPEEFQQTKAAFQKEYDALRNALEASSSNSGSKSDVDAILSEALLAKEMRNYLEQHEYPPSDELLTRMDNFRAALAQMPAEYFETKFERPVRLNEFAGAIIPNDTAPETITALRNSGVKTIEQYDPAAPGSRAKALKALADKLDQDTGVYFMKTPQGEVYGFTTGDKIYLDSSLMNAATPMHEYTELWSQIVARENPEWWSRAKQIMQSDEGRLGEIWKAVNADPNYRSLSEEMRASETISRASAELFEREQAGIQDNEGLFASLRKLIREFWEKVKSALSGKWSAKELHDMTAEEVMRTPVKDFVEGINLQKYTTEVGNTPRFARDFTERKQTTLEKLENKRAALIAEKENIANFDERLAVADAEIEAYSQVDHIAETYADAESDAHLQAVEDVVYDIVRKEGVEGVQVDVVRSPDAMLEYARKHNWAKEDIEKIERGLFSFGYYGDGEITLPAWLVNSKKNAKKYFWHERTHGVTDETSTPDKLTSAAEQAGVELMDRALAEREYTSDQWSLERQADEYVARAVEIIAGKDLLVDYLAMPETEITPIADYLEARSVPQELADIILKDCEFIKNQKYGIDTRIRNNRNHRGGGNEQGILSANTSAGGSVDGASEAGREVGKSSSSGESGVSGAETGNRASASSSDRHAVGTASGALESDGASNETGNGAVEAGNSLARRGYSVFDGNSDADGDAGGVRRNGEVGFQQHLDSAPKLTRQQQLIADLRRVTPLERMENQRASLIAEKENIVNFDDKEQAEWQTRYDDFVAEAAMELAVAYAPEAKLLCIRSDNDIKAYRELGQIITGTNVSEDEASQIKEEVDAMLAAGNRAFVWQNTIIMPSAAYRTLPIQTMAGDVIHESVHTRINRNVSAETLKAIYDEALPSSRLLAKIDTHSEYAHLTPERKAGELLAYAISRQAENADSEFWRYVYGKGSLDKVNDDLLEDLGNSELGLRLVDRIINEITNDYGRFRNIQGADEGQSADGRRRKGVDSGLRNDKNTREGGRNTRDRSGSSGEVLRDTRSYGAKSGVNIQRGKDGSNVAEERVRGNTNEIEAYKLSDPVADTYGNDGANAESDAHLKAVEEAARDIQRVLNIGDNRITVARDVEDYVAICEALGHSRSDVVDSNGKVANGFCVGKEIVVYAGGMQKKQTVLETILHERTHFLTNTLIPETELYEAGGQIGAEYIDYTLQKRSVSYRVNPEDRASIAEGVGEMISRDIDILTREGLMADYLADEAATAERMAGYMKAHDVPEALAALVLEQSENIKADLYGKQRTRNSQAVRGIGAEPGRSDDSLRQTDEGQGRQDDRMGDVRNDRGGVGGGLSERGSDRGGGTGEGGSSDGNVIPKINAAFADDKADSAPKLTRQQQLIADPVAATAAEPESDTHLRAVEDVVEELRRVFGIENPVHVVRNETGFIDRCRELGVPETFLAHYEQENCPNGIRIGDIFLIRANDKKHRVDAEKTLLHEQAHFITRYTWMESDAGLETLYDAAVEAGADYMNQRLERRDRSYHVDADDPDSMVDGINEMISRNVDILWKKGVLQNYMYAEGNALKAVDAYMSAHGVPDGLKKLILYQCKELKYGKAEVQSEKDPASDHSRLFPAGESHAAANDTGRGVDDTGREIAGIGVGPGGEGVAGNGDGYLGGGRGRDINPSFSENSDDFTDTTPKLTKQQQLIADLRRAVRESKASVRAVAQIVSRRVREEVGRDMAEVMGKREFDALIRQVEQATLRNEVERPLRRIGEIVYDLEIKRTQASIDTGVHYLKFGVPCVSCFSSLIVCVRFGFMNQKGGG